MFDRISVSISRRKGDQIFMKSDSLMQPLPGLVQGIYSVPNAQTITTVTWHSSSGIQDETKKSQAC